MDSVRKQQILASEAQLIAAMKASDVDALDALLHDDLLFNGPTGETATKAMDLANYRSGGVRLALVEPSDYTLSAIDDDVIVAVTVQLDGEYMGQRATGRFRYLRVWKRYGETWRVIGGSVVPLGPAG
ncbi:MAG: nuclear transport factor 2 family protein [Cytophagaceae bacterium]|nr:nuclear transport factor 2 family protein [Gemmatimonadaceae bacterium]